MTLSLVKSLVRKLVQNTPFRDRLNDTCLYQLYTRLRYPEHHAQKQRELVFLAQLLSAGRCELVFDIGANHGNKAIVYARLVARVICLEPDPSSAAFLESRLRNEPGVTIVHAGVGAHPGTLPFHVLIPGGATNTFSAQWAATHGPDANIGFPAEVIPVQVVTIEDLINQYGVPDYVKIDAEGFEFNILSGLARPLPLISFECDLAEFPVPSADCVRRMASLDPECEFNFSTSDQVTSFESVPWMKAEEMLACMANPRNSFMEVFVRSKCG